MRRVFKATVARVRRLDRASGHWVELAVFADQAIVRAESFDFEFTLSSLWW